MNDKIIAALVMGIVVIGLIGAASASLLDDYLAHTSIDYTSPTISISEDYYGSHVSDFSMSGITTHTDVTVYESPSMFDSYASESYTSGPSIFDSYAPAPSTSIFDSTVPSYSFWP